MAEVARGNAHKAEWKPWELTDEEIQSMLAHLAITTKDIAPALRVGGQTVYDPFAIIDPTLLARALADAALAKVRLWLSVGSYRSVLHSYAPNGDKRETYWRVLPEERWQEWS